MRIRPTTRDPSVGLVLAGGGARGAYEAGALSVLLPYLEERGEVPGLVLGTSIGSLNASHLAATAHLPVAESLARLLQLWRDVQFSDIIGPLVSPWELVNGLRYVGGLLGMPYARSPALLDTTPLPRLLREILDVGQIHRNVDDGLVALAVAATSYASGGSVVFYDGQRRPAVETDISRAIRYVPTPIFYPHVQASASIPVAFPATWVEAPAEAAGWYGDGGTRLNTPIKPALELGAERVVVIGLNSTAPPLHADAGRPDVFDGAAQCVQALLADPLAQDVATLAGYNSRVDGGSTVADDKRAVPYIFIAPRDRLTVGELAARVFGEHLSGLRGMLRARDLAMLGKAIGAGRTAVRGELFSFLFFATEFHEALITLGRDDAERWLELTHDDGPWRLGKPPLPARLSPPVPIHRNRPQAPVGAHESEGMPVP